MIYDVIIIGAGLAGLGIINSLPENKNILLIEAVKPKLDGLDKYDPKIPASFKNAGMLDMGSSFHSIKEYFAKRTIDLYRNLGVPVRDNGGYVMASRFVNSLATDVMLRKVSRNEFSEREPDIELSKKLRGIYKFQRGSQAEPEETMKILIEHIKKRKNVHIEYHYQVDKIFYDKGEWSVKATFLDPDLVDEQDLRENLEKRRTNSIILFTGKKLVVAAGPGSNDILKTANVNIQTRNVLGVMASDEPQFPLYLRGSIMGAKSYVYWTAKEVIHKILTCGGETLEVTSILNESKTWTTHLYINEYNGRMYIGGPRVLLCDKGSCDYIDGATDPATHEKEMRDTIEYAKTLVNLPNMTFPVDKMWTGEMCFAKDDDYPIVGEVPEKIAGPGLYVSTAFASAGFREAFGAGEYLAKIMTQGTDWLKETNDPDLKHWKKVDPVHRLTL